MKIFLENQRGRPCCSGGGAKPAVGDRGGAEIWADL